MNSSARLLARTILCAAVAAVVAACGGGSTDGVGSDAADAGGKSASAVVYTGSITGLGSVVVNGVRFSSVGAELVDDDGALLGLNQLKLGMTVEVNGRADEANSQGTATRLELQHGNRGLVTAVDTAGGALTLLGQRIQTTPATAYQGVGGLAAVTVGSVVEVHGTIRSDGTMLATLVEVKAASSSVNVVGRVSQVDVSKGTFQLGTLTVDFRSAALTGTLLEGARVKVRANSGPVDGVLAATMVRASSTMSMVPASTPSGTWLKIKGIAELAPVNGTLIVSGTPVNVADARIEGGGAIVAGQFVEVRGRWDGAALVATQLELEGDRERRIGGRHELYGAVSSRSGTSVVVNGVLVDLSRALFEHGAADQVSVGSYVEIKGNVVGDTLLATKVELKSGSALAGVSYEQFGPISAFVSIASFKVNGLEVDASRALFEHGSAASLAPGIHVEIKGTQDGSGVFVASKVEIKNGQGD